MADAKEREPDLRHLTNSVGELGEDGFGEGAGTARKVVVEVARAPGRR
jgi:hypothetical protein